MSTFKVTENKGFQMTFENGWTVSVQWGPMNYCKKRTTDLSRLRVEPNEDWNSPDAEIAAWDANKNWYDFGGDEVKGWCSPDEVAKFCNKVRKF